MPGNRNIPALLPLLKLYYSYFHFCFYNNSYFSYNFNRTCYYNFYSNNTTVSHNNLRLQLHQLLRESDGI